MSYCYIGYAPFAKWAKIGETTQSPAKRTSDINAHLIRPYKLEAVLEIKEIDGNTFCKAVEGHMRAKLVQAGYRRVHDDRIAKHDFFYCTEEELPGFIETARNVAISYCEREGIKYHKRDWI